MGPGTGVEGRGYWLPTPLCSSQAPPHPHSPEGFPFTLLGHRPSSSARVTVKLCFLIFSLVPRRTTSIGSCPPFFWSFVGDPSRSGPAALLGAGLSWLVSLSPNHQAL